MVYIHDALRRSLHSDSVGLLPAQERVVRTSRPEYS